MDIFTWLALAVLLFFYGIFFGKMLLQRKKGIQTHQVGSCQEKSVRRVERIMSAATLGVVLAQLASIALHWSCLPSGVRFAGFGVGMCGNLLFLISVYTMKDSWRAGIPGKDKTEFISDGIYAYSRNPAFLGFDLMYVGVLALYFNPLTLIFTAFAAVSLHLQILQEETYLTGRFGEEYTAYTRRVSRYLGKK